MMEWVRSRPGPTNPHRRRRLEPWRLDRARRHVPPPGAERRRHQLDGLPEEPLAGLVGAFVLYPLRASARCGARAASLSTSRQGAGRHGRRRRRRQRLAKRCRRCARQTPIEVVMRRRHPRLRRDEAQDLRVRYDPELTERAHGMYADFLNALAGTPVPAAIAKAGG